MNRIIIKATHFPVLFCIYMYERFWLAPSMYEPTDLVENPGRGRGRTISFADPTNRNTLFSPNVRVREESVAGFQKDRALEEVFRRAPAASTLRTQRRNERHKTQTAIRNWMDQNDDEGASPGNWPSMDSRAVPEWQRRLSVGWERSTSNLRKASDLRSTTSDPADLVSNAGASSMPNRAPRSPLIPVIPDYKDNTDADGDDELVTNDEDEDDGMTNAPDMKRQDAAGSETEEDYFTTPMTTKFGKLPSSLGSSRGVPVTPRATGQKRAPHNRTLSTNTILYNPEAHAEPSAISNASPPKIVQPMSRLNDRAGIATAPATPGRRSSPRRSIYIQNTRPRPILHPRGATENGGAFSRSALLNIDERNRPRDRRRLSSVDLSILSDNINIGGDDPNAGMPGSFQTQMAMAMMKDNRLRGAGGGDSADRDRMGRLVLARMKTLEESFADVVKEMRDLKYTSTGPPSRRNSSAEEHRMSPLMEATGRDRLKKVKGNMSPRKGQLGRRPGSRRSNKEPKVGSPLISSDAKGKGKEVAYSSDDEGPANEGSFLKGSSL